MMYAGMASAWFSVRDMSKSWLSPAGRSWREVHWVIIVFVVVLGSEGGDDDGDEQAERRAAHQGMARK
jgi:hypothetical protein